MTAYRHVLVGTDGSATAQSAVYAAGAIAHALRVPITVATAWYRDSDHDGFAQIAGSEQSARNASWATDQVVDAAASLRAAGLDDVRTATPEGGPADALVRLGEQTEGALTVVGTVGLDQAAERLLGNIPNQLTHHAPTDLFLCAGRDYTPDVTWANVALATDGSRTASRAVEAGLAFARAVGARATLVTVASSEDKGRRVLDDAATHLAGGEELPRDVIVSRDVSGALTDGVHDYDLLVLGNKGMSGPSRLLGSVPNRVTHHLPTDMLLVNTTR